MKRLIVLFAFVFATIVAAAQELIAVRGKVIDESGKSISAASVVVAGSHIATVSNEDGYFTIKIPKSVSKLIVSHLGYQTETVNVESGKLLKVKLFSKAIFLNELLVGDPHDILALAIRNIPENYLMTPSLQSCFYREMTRKGSRFIYVAEAVTDMYKTSYSHEIANDRVAIRKARRLISTSHKDTLGAKKPKIKAETALLMGDFYIDVSTLAIRHIELQLDMSDRENAIRFMLERKPFGVRFRPREFNITIDYRYDNAGRLFLGYIRTDISFKCDWKRKLFSSPYHVISEMVVTDLQTENVKPVRGRQVFLSHESLYDRVEFFNDSTFWQQYNIIEPTESLEKGIERSLKKATL